MSIQFHFTLKDFVMNLIYSLTPLWIIGPMVLIGIVMLITTPTPDRR